MATLWGLASLFWKVMVNGSPAGAMRQSLLNFTSLAEIVSALPSGAHVGSLACEAVNHGLAATPTSTSPAKAPVHLFTGPTLPCRSVPVSQGTLATSSHSTTSVPVIRGRWT